MSTSWTTELLNDYLDDRLSPEARAELEQTLREQIGARETLRELQQLRNRLQAVPRYRLPGDFARTVVDHLETATPSPERPAAAGPQATIAPSGNGSWRVPIAMIATLAASLLLIVIIRPWALNPDHLAARGADEAAAKPASAPASQVDGAARPFEPADSRLPDAQAVVGEAGKLAGDAPLDDKRLGRKGPAGMESAGESERTRAEAVPHDGKEVPQSLRMRLSEDQPAAESVDPAAMPGPPARGRSDTRQANRPAGIREKTNPPGPPAPPRANEKMIGNKADPDQQEGRLLQAETGPTAGESAGMPGLAGRTKSMLYYSLPDRPTAVVVEVETTAENWQAANRFARSLGRPGNEPGETAVEPLNRQQARNPESTLNRETEGLAFGGGRETGDDTGHPAAEAGILDPVPSYIVVDTTASNIEQVLARLGGTRNVILGHLPDVEPAAGFATGSPGGGGGGPGGGSQGSGGDDGMVGRSAARGNQPDSAEPDTPKPETRRRSDIEAAGDGDSAAEPATNALPEGQDEFYWAPYFRADDGLTRSGPSIHWFLNSTPGDQADAEPGTPVDHVDRQGQDPPVTAEPVQRFLIVLRIVEWPAAPPAGEAGVRPGDN